MPIDVLIVGQGLAGSLLAWTLLQQHFRVMVLDDGAENASRVAAGLINPVTGQRLVKTADVDTLLPAAMACFQQLSAAFQQRFFVPMPMWRLLKTAQQQALAVQRLQQAEYQAYLAGCSAAPVDINSAYGVLHQQQTGYLRTRPLLAALRDFFIAKGSYRQLRLDYQELVLQPCLQWRDVQPQHIVFCEGYQATANPWFGTLPFQPAKGEILECQALEALPAQILNYGHWLIPLDAQHFKMGATFIPGQTDNQPTSLARRQLLAGLAAVRPGLSIDVLAQHAGIRPATLDKQPFVGAHPIHPRMHIFNGFGAKGSLAIPWHAQQFVLALQQRATQPNTSHIQRYYDAHFPI